MEIQVKNNIKKLKINDVSLVEGCFSRFSREMDIDDIIKILPFMDNAGFDLIEVGGFESFSCGFEEISPFEKIRTIKNYLMKTPLMMKISALHLVGRNRCKKEVLEEFIKRSVESGIDVFRVYDPLNNVESIKNVSSIIKKFSKKVQACICLDKDFHKEKISELAKKIQALGADEILVYDPQGIAEPFEIGEIIEVLKNSVSLSIGFSTRNTFGTGDISSYFAVISGVDFIDSAVSACSGKNSFISCEGILNSFKNHIKTEIKKEELIKISKTFNKDILLNYSNSKDIEISSLPDLELSKRKIPLSVKLMLKKELIDVDSKDKLENGLDLICSIKSDLGDIPYIYPLDRILVTQTVNNLLFDDEAKQYKILSKHVKDHCAGFNGKTRKPVSGKVLSLITKDDFENDKDENSLLLEKLSDGDFLKLIFPENEKNSQKIIKSEKHVKTSNCRHFNVYINDNLYDVAVDINDPDIKIADLPTAVPVKKEADTPEKKVSQVEKKKPDTQVGKKAKQENKEPVPVSGSAEVSSPMPGTIAKVLKKQGDSIKKGESVLLLEAMKMENPIPSPCDGKIVDICFNQGDNVSKNDLLFKIG